MTFKHKKSINISAQEIAKRGSLVNTYSHVHTMKWKGKRILCFPSRGPISARTCETILSDKRHSTRRRDGEELSFRSFPAGPRDLDHPATAVRPAVEERSVVWEERLVAGTNSANFRLPCLG